MKKLILMLLLVVGGVNVASADNMYILGDEPLGTWAPNAGLLMNDNGDGTFYYEFTANKTGDQYFCFSEALSNDGTWNTFNANCYRPSPSNTNSYVGIYTEFTEVSEKGNPNGDNSKSFHVYVTNGKKYGIVFDKINKTIRFYEAADNVYIIGTLGDHTWASNSGIQMDATSKPYVFTAIVEAKGLNNDNNDTNNSYFSFTTQYASTWDDMASYRFGANANAGTDFEVTNEMVINGSLLQLEYWAKDSRAFKLPLGLYRLTVDRSISKLVIKKLETVTVNSNGFATFVNTNPINISGAIAYTATDNGNGSALLYSRTNPAAGTAMLIKGDASTTYYFEVAASGTDYSSDNAFKAGPVTGLASQDGSNYNYVLNGNTFYAANGKNVGEGKAYLQLSSNGQAPARADLIFPEEGTTTTVNTISAVKENDNTIYNVQGVKVANPTKGLYIKNGKKYFVK